MSKKRRKRIIRENGKAYTLKEIKPFYKKIGFWFQLIQLVVIAGLILFIKYQPFGVQPLHSESSSSSDSPRFSDPLTSSTTESSSEVQKVEKVKISKDEKIL